MFGHLKIEEGGGGKEEEEEEEEEEGRIENMGRGHISKQFVVRCTYDRSYLLWTQACLDLPEPPNLIMSRQKVHLPQSAS